MLYARSIGEQNEAMFVPAKVPRYFGVLPGRRLVRIARTRLALLWALAEARVRLFHAVFSAEAREWIETLRVEREAAAAWRRREQALRALGEAVHHDFGAEIERAKARVVELDGQLLELGKRVREAQEQKHMRVERAWREAVESSEPVIAPRPRSPRAR
jgi:hypothetical protein